MNREVHVRFWESAELRCSAPLDYRQDTAVCSAKAHWTPRTIKILKSIARHNAVITSAVS